MDLSAENCVTPPRQLSVEMADMTNHKRECRRQLLPLDEAADDAQVKKEALLPSKRKVFSHRLVPTRKYQSLVEYNIQDANTASDRITTYTLDHDEVNPGYALVLQSVLLGMEPTDPISPDKHVQLDQLKQLPKKKLFRYESEGIFEQEGKADKLGLSPLGQDDPDCKSDRKVPRRIPKSPYKVLDAPSLADDFYLNLVDWSSENILAVGLGACVYLWNASTSTVTKLCDLSPMNTVCSVAFSQRAAYLSIGTVMGEVQVWDVQSLKKTHTLTGHRVRVGTMSWSTTSLTSGSRDRFVLHHDLRKETTAHKLVGHTSEVCGLKWSTDDRQLASGGNDNKLLIWELRASETPIVGFEEHTAAVKAIAWSPHQHGLLASGGGTADRHIRFWSTTKEQSLKAIDTGSQVCNLSWSKNANEIVSTHGYSQNQVVVWKYPDMTRLSTLTGHSSRVLYLAVSPDGQTIVTGAGDETLRFWSVFPPMNGHSARGNNISTHSNYR